MKPARFAHHAAHSVAEAVDTLSRLAPQGGRILAGGQSLVPMMAFRLATPPDLIDINAIPNLDALTTDGTHLRIGALVRHAAFRATPNPLRALLATLARHIAHLPIRTRGTFCGSLAHADPASEWCLAFAALDGDAIASSVAGERSIPAGAFFQGVMTTALRSDEMLVAAHLPELSPDARWGFHECNRRAGDYALAMSLAGFRTVDNRIIDARIAIGGAEPFPRRLSAVEDFLNGAAPGADTFGHAAELAADCIDPMEDAQADARFRRDLIRASVRRALTACA